MKFAGAQAAFPEGPQSEFSPYVRPFTAAARPVGGATVISFAAASVTGLFVTDVPGVEAFPVSETVSESWADGPQPHEIAVEELQL